LSAIKKKYLVVDNSTHFACAILNGDHLLTTVTRRIAMMKSDGVPKTKPKRRTITINRDAAVLDALDNQARANKCNSTPDFLLMCANAYSAAVDLQSSAALGQMGRDLNALTQKVWAEETSIEELTVALHRCATELRRLPFRLRTKT